VRFIEVPDGDLHGKFLLWDADAVIVTSLNWSPADTRGDAPYEALRARQSLTPDKLILASLCRERWMRGSSPRITPD
jgi:hypothetical protein